MRMIRIGKRANHALVALTHLVEVGRPVSAREVAEAHNVPVAGLMQVLKRLQQGGLVRSVRGVNGGYEAAVPVVQKASLLDLMCLLREQDSPDAVEADDERLRSHPATAALRYRVSRFMASVNLADLVLPGRRIDVPLEWVGCKCGCDDDHKAGKAAEARTATDTGAKKQKRRDSASKPQARPVGA
ncbi:MAG: RrF2 family transcriptional regulator [Phycisphaerae bacterium]